MSKFKLKNLIRAIFKKEFKLNVNDQINNNNNHNISEKKISDKKYKIKIITSYDEGYSEVGNKTKETFKKYAEIQGYNFENITMPNSGRPPAWNKIRILMDEMIKKEFEFLMWIDADAFFNNYDIDIANEIEQEKEIYMVKHYCEVHKGSIYQNTKLTILRINTGVLLMKNSEHNLKFLQKVWDKKEYINHQWWEQAAIMDVMNFKSELNGNLNDNKGNYYLEKVKFISNNWNSIPSNLDLGLEKQDPIIIHLAGMEFEERIKYVNTKLKL
tara:strand:- start:912 stop:1724 length:813 start_codon:yes stop_codon:yes gene_type:complete